METKKEQAVEKLESQSSPPSGIQVILREFKKDKLALGSVIFIVLLMLTVLVLSVVIDQAAVMKIQLLERLRSRVFEAMSLEPMKLDEICSDN